MYINARPFLHTPRKDTRAYQLAVLDILADIDAIANEFEVDYTLEAGSALGAVRHGGFIPWDNDSDILMPIVQVKAFFVGLAKTGMLEKYDIWYYDKQWGWMKKDIFLAGILRDPNHYCDTSLNWLVGELTYGMFRLVLKETMPIRMSLSKSENTYQVAHFDTSLSTASLAYRVMLPEEKRTWQRRYLLNSEIYQVNPFVDIFPSVEMTPDAYIKMKRGFRADDMLTKVFDLITAPRKSWPKLLKSILPTGHKNRAQTIWSAEQFQDYRVGVGIDYSKGITRAKQIKEFNDNVVLSKAPWNLRKIVPYAKSQLYPTARMKFESIEVNVPNKIVDILENHYRDFRTPPPENERIQHAYHLDPNQFEQVVRVNV